MKRRMMVLAMTTAAAGAVMAAAPTVPPTGTATSGVAGSAPATTATQPGTARGRGRGAGGAGGMGRGQSAVSRPWMQDPVTGEMYTPQRHVEYAFGADVSSLWTTERNGNLPFKDGGQAKPALQIFRDHGFNWVRLRVCHEPAQLPQTTAYAVSAAKDAKARGFKVLLDFHMAPGWADPRWEAMIPEWANLAPAQMRQAMFEYTRDTVAAFAKEDCLPEIIQVGNEVSNGFLMPAGQLPEHWDDFAGLVYAGINGIDAGRGNGKRPRIMIHVDHGGDVPKTKAFFDKFNSYDIPYDMIGFSFYPWSHGTLLDLKENLAFTAKTYQKDMMVVETGYCHSPSQYFGKTPGPYPETPEGQAQFMAAVNQAVMEAPEGRGKGIFYWEPTSTGRGEMSARSFFDAQGNVLPVMDVFRPYAFPPHRTDNQ
jgi:arabinogalactan endo-1,4-beta-galactosidase